MCGRRIQFVGLVLLVCLGISAPPAHAEMGRPVGWQLGSDHQTLRYARVTMHHATSLSALAAELVEMVPGWWIDIENQLGVDVQDDVEIHFVDHAGRVADATGMPRWVVGVAHGPSGRIAIARHQPDGSRAELRGLLRHELAHIATHRALGGHRMPRWFHEGVAESIGEEIDLARAQTLATAVFGRGVPPMDRMEQYFRSEDPRLVAVAYAASRDFVRYLRYRAANEAAFHYFVGQIRRGHAMKAAFHHAYGVSMAELEREWRASLGMRFVWYVLLSSASMPFVAATPLMLLAWLRRRRQRGARLAAMAREEQAYFAGASVRHWH